ncbi:MAG: polyprenyl synthetase family protein [Acidothermus cellulolyticus]|nr:polyprenyl synthetase family protein [Acidothermus cellulolyticus]
MTQSTGMTGLDIGASTGPAEAGLSMVIPDAGLRTRVRDGLEAVETLLRQAVRSSGYPFLTETSRHLVDAGGKRFRPLLVLLAAEYGDPTAPGVVPAAAVVELTHLATLYHDDVMDEAVVRRGTASANARWSNTIAILTGDFLFSRASDLLADLGPEAVRIQARTFERLVQGQIRETLGPEEGVDPVEHYLRVVADKTGSLIATAARFGAMFSGAPAWIVDVMVTYGERIGTAFQLSDDLLDVMSDSTESGKAPGTDLREGVRTLPVLHVLRSMGPSDGRLRELLNGDLTDDERHRETLALLRAHPAMERARADLRRWVSEARAALEPLPDQPATQALQRLCDFVLARTG